MKELSSQTFCRWKTGAERGVYYNWLGKTLLLQRAGRSSVARGPIAAKRELRVGVHGLRSGWIARPPLSAVAIVIWL